MLELLPKTRRSSQNVLKVFLCKESVSQDFPFFHDLNPSDPLANRLNIFEFGHDFAEIFEFLRNSSADPEKSRKKNSQKTPVCRRGVKINTAESDLKTLLFTGCS